MKKRIPSTIERISDKCTSLIGSPVSLVVHSVFFVLFFVAGLLGVEWNDILLILTTIVSLEAIYLAIFIQISVNRNTKSLLEVEEDIDEIQEDIDEIQEDVDEIQEDVGEIQEEVDEIAEETSDEEGDIANEKALQEIQETLKKLLTDFESLRQNTNQPK
jgi:uncharacterized membrane protein